MGMIVTVTELGISRWWLVGLALLLVVLGCLRISGRRAPRTGKDDSTQASEKATFEHHPDATWFPADMARPATKSELKNPVHAAYATFWKGGRLRAVHTVARNGRVLSEGLEISELHDAGTYSSGVRSWESFGRDSRTIYVDYGDETDTIEEAINFEEYVRGRLYSLVQGYDQILLVPEGLRLWQSQFWEQPEA